MVGEPKAQSERVCGRWGKRKRGGNRKHFWCIYRALPKLNQKMFPEMNKTLFKSHIKSNK